MLAIGTGGSSLPFVGMFDAETPLTYFDFTGPSEGALDAATLPSDFEYGEIRVTSLARDLTIEEERILTAALIKGSRIVARGRLIR